MLPDTQYYRMNPQLHKKRFLYKGLNLQNVHMLQVIVLFLKSWNYSISPKRCEIFDNNVMDTRRSVRETKGILCALLNYQVIVVSYFVVITVQIVQLYHRKKSPMQNLNACTHSEVNWYHQVIRLGFIATIVREGIRINPMLKCVW